MPSATTSQLVNMSQQLIQARAADQPTYQANGLVRSNQQQQHHHSSFAIGGSKHQTALEQKLLPPATSPSQLYQQYNQYLQHYQSSSNLTASNNTTSSSNGSNNNNMQFQPPSPLVAPLIPHKSDANGHNSIIQPIVSSNNNTQSSQILIQGHHSNIKNTQQQQPIYYSQQQQQQQQQQLVNSNQITIPSAPSNGSLIMQQQPSQQQQQVPMTTLMIPASAAASIQSASVQIQQAALQGLGNSPHNQAQIMIFMIPCPALGPPSSMLPPISSPYSQLSTSHQSQLSGLMPQQYQSIATPENSSSVNSTLVRHTQSTSSLLRSSQNQQQLQQHQQQRQFQQQPQQNQQQLQSAPIANTTRAVSSLSLSANQYEHQQQQQLSSSIANTTRALSSLSLSTSQYEQQHQEQQQQQTQHHHHQQKTSFYIRANFTYTSDGNKMKLPFEKGDILHVLDTLQNSDYGSQYWLATRVKPTGEDAEKGLIPDKNKADRIYQYVSGYGSSTNLNGAGDNNSSLSGTSSLSGKVNFLKRKSAQRSKSLCKDDWDNVVFDIGSFELPTYERVVFKHPGFCRPVVIFGPLADVAREKLLKDYPEKYAYPAGFHHHQQQMSGKDGNNNTNPQSYPKVIRIKGIVEVINQGKHALLDITPSAVEKLNYVNLAPIVIFMKTESKSIIKEFRARATKSLDYATSNNNILDDYGSPTNNNNNDDGSSTLRSSSSLNDKSSRKLLEQSMKLEKSWYRVFTAVLDLSTMGSEMWYRKLRETIESQQSANVWMGERKSDHYKKIMASNTINNTGEPASLYNSAAQPPPQQQQQQLAVPSSSLSSTSSSSSSIYMLYLQKGM